MIKHTFPDKLGILKASKNNYNSWKLSSLESQGVGPSKNWVTWRGPIILLERGGSIEKSEVDKEMAGRGGATFLLLYSSIAFTKCGGEK